MSKLTPEEERKDRGGFREPLSNFWLQESIRISQEQRKRHEEMGAMHKYDRWKYDKENSGDKD